MTLRRVAAEEQSDLSFDLQSGSLHVTGQFLESVVTDVLYFPQFTPPPPPSPMQ